MLEPDPMGVCSRGGLVPLKAALFYTGNPRLLPSLQTSIGRELMSRPCTYRPINLLVRRH